MNKLIRIIAVITFFCVFSCKVVSKDFFCFGTEEYKQKEKKNRINTDEAADLFANFQQAQFCIIIKQENTF